MEPLESRVVPKGAITMVVWECFLRIPCQCSVCSPLSWQTCPSWQTCFIVFQMRGPQPSDGCLADPHPLVTASCSLTSSRADWQNCISKKTSRIHTTRLARVYRLDLFQQKSQAFAWILKGYVLIKCCPFFGIAFFFMSGFTMFCHWFRPNPFQPIHLCHQRHGTQDILQFCSAIFVADEAETFSVSVMRLGSLDGEVRCHYRTQDTLAQVSSRGMWRKRDGYIKNPRGEGWNFEFVFFRWAVFIGGDKDSGFQCVVNCFVGLILKYFWCVCFCCDRF